MKDTAFFEKALGLEKPWRVGSVKMDVAAKRVEIEVECEAKVPWASEAGERLHIHGYEERCWRHLDTMQFETLIRARVPRVKHPDGHTELVRVPWAGPHARFTLLFEAWAIQVLQVASSVQEACSLLGVDWHWAQNIMDRAVERGLEKRSVEGLAHVGLDEKSFRRGQSYVSVMVDIDASRVLEVVEGCGRDQADELWAGIGEAERAGIKAVAMDMSESFIGSTEVAVPGAAIVHDRFHVSAHLNEAVDRVRRAENKELLARGDERLKGTRQIWLFNPENLDTDQWNTFAELKQAELKVGRAHQLKELFRRFWEYKYVGAAERFFSDWYSWASRSRLAPIMKVAKMLKRHLHNLVTYISHPITNAKCEAFNSRIQSIKSAARGFRNFYNYRTRILFFLGKLELAPSLH